jgi:hypothetical protein
MENKNINKKAKSKTMDIATLPSNQQQTAAIVMPAVCPEEALAAWQEYQELKKKIIDPKQDIQIIQGKEFLKKSYWRKIATFFNLSVEIVEEKKEVLNNGLMVWHFICKATAPNRRYTTGTGSCDNFEKAILKDGKYMKKGEVLKWGKTQTGKSYPKEWAWTEAMPNSIHNVRSTAETRAYNRSVSNLVGGGEISAEEMVEKEENGYSSKEYSGNNTNKSSPKLVTMPEILKQVEKATCLQDLIAIYEEFEKYRNVHKFKNAIAKKKEELVGRSEKKTEKPHPAQDAKFREACDRVQERIKKQTEKPIQASKEERLDEFVLSFQSASTEPQLNQRFYNFRFKDLQKEEVAQRRYKETLAIIQSRK